MTAGLMPTALPIVPHAGDRFAITFAPLSLAEAYEQATDPANGAVVVMSGMVRNQTDGRPVVSAGISSL